MQFQPSKRVWLALGASLAVSGGFTILVSLPSGSRALWLGVGLVAAGSLALRAGLDSGSPAVDRPPRDAARPKDLSKVEPELLRPAPRAVVMTARGRTVVLAWMITLAGFATLASKHFALLPPPEMKARLESAGVPSQASVHSRDARAVGGDRTLFFVGYSFVTASGTPVRVSTSVPEGVFNRLSEGDTVEVLYFPGNPNRHFLPGLTSPVSTRMVVFAGCLLVVAAGFVEAQRRLHRRLVASGSAISGVIADVRRRGGVRSFLVNYESGGERRTLKARERNPDLRNGQLATVLYDPASASRAIIYRISLYRARA